VQEDERQIIDRCKQGDLSAFDELVHRYEKSVFNLAYRMTGNYDDAGDVASEAFVKVFNAITSFRGDASFATWVYRIATNVYLDHRKRQKGHQTTSLDEYLELEENSVARQIVDPSPVPGELLEARERRAALDHAISLLPEYQRLMVVMFHMDGKTYEEIAEIMCLPIGTVKSRLNRARLALRDKLKSSLELFEG
jgi:RNA polymerase sigma-70 factor (ECF subfamily)